MKNNQPIIKKSPKLPPEYENLTANIALYKLLKNGKFNTVLDIGSGAGDHAAILEAAGKKVTRFDFGKSRAFDSEGESDKTIIGDYLTYKFSQEFDCIWASHVLEHTVFTHEFLVKLTKDCRPNGTIVITVPPAKAQLVGGHVTLWTPALLLYRAVLAGIDCSNAKIMRYGYNISLIAQNKANNVDLSELAWDLHDIDRLKAYFPKGVEVRMNGDYVGTVYEDAQINMRR